MLLIVTYTIGCTLAYNPPMGALPRSYWCRYLVTDLITVRVQQHVTKTKSAGNIALSAIISFPTFTYTITAYGL